MNIKQKIIRSKKLIGLVLTMLLAYVSADAQCYITTSGQYCVDEPIQFNCNSIGSSNYNWDFSGEGTNNLICNPSFIFTTPGNKTINVTLKMSNGQTCNASLTINVKTKPIINVKRVVNKTQCFANNSFCFTDSSKAVVPGVILKRTIVVFDDGVKYTFMGDGPRVFCHSFQDPAGGTYGMTIEVEDSTGCIRKTRINAVAVVQPSLGLSFSSPQPKKCDSVLLCVTNNSTVPLDSIKQFRWIWGDGFATTGDTTKPSWWGPQVCHWFKSQGPSNGNFTTVLDVTTHFGCNEKFTFNASATNLIVKPVIISDFDSLCVTDATFQFALKDGPVPQASNTLWWYEWPQNSANTTRNSWVGTHKFGGVGPYKINFSFSHAIPGCARTVYDTILVIGPVSVIEGPPWLTDSLRSQCIIKDTVKFLNSSKFYHNDKNFFDDDSLYIIYDSALISKSTGAILPSNTPFNFSLHEWIYPGFNAPMVHNFPKRAGEPHQFPGDNPKIIGANEQRGNSCVLRVWDFDDDYCEKCTTDTKNGVNIGKNCKFSKDSLPQHWYTPWDSLYQTRFGLQPQNVLDYNSDSGLCYQKKMYSDEEVAIIRDTILYYGNNPLAIKTKDSSAYSKITNKIMVQNVINGIVKIDYTVATKFYLQGGTDPDTIFIDANNGLPPNRWIGPRYITVQPGSTLIIKSKTDKAMHNVWMVVMQDTIPRHLVQSWHKVYSIEPMPGIQFRDSVNAAAHRQKFYSSTTVKCFNVRLWHKDICHPLACEHQAISQLALMPPSAKKLRKLGTLCLGGDQDDYGITFVLTDTKPGCNRTWAKINYDTALNKQGWVTAIGPNLSGGAIPTGGLPPVNPPYLGYPIAGPPPSRYSKQFVADDIKDTITGYINVGLIVGNGIWKEPYHAADGEDEGLNYPLDCADTVYYPKFARFPILDNRFRIIKPQEGTDYTKICKRDTLSVTTLAWNRTYVPDVAEAVWSLTAPNVGKFYNQYYRLTVTERYKRFQRIKGDTTKNLTDSTPLEDRITIIKESFFHKTLTLIDSQEFRIAKVLRWHTEADITPVFDIINTILTANNIDIYELSPAQLNQLIWNGKGTFGKPFTGSRGCLDTTGFGRFIRFYKVADKKDSSHFRDTTLLPVDTVKGFDGKLYNAYSFVPQHSGYYVAQFALRSTAPENCRKELGASKKVIVGFYSVMNYTDTILCNGQEVVASPYFRYFNVYPELGNTDCPLPGSSLLDCIDYWRTRKGEAGQKDREGFTRTDLSMADDDLSKPLTIFGGFPYSITGLDNKPNNILQLGGLTNGIYYMRDTGDVYHIRTAASDSFGCHDTVEQDVYISAVRAKFNLDQSRPQCNTIVEFFDSSYVMDPCVNKLGSPCDKIIKWTIFWGDNSHNAVNSYFDVLPANIAHDFTRNGVFWIRLRVETELGCIAWDSMELYIPGPIPFFDTTIPKKYCVRDRVDFNNLSTYIKRDSSIWIWSFGDGAFGNQYDTITSTNDTTNHRYLQPGRYNIFLYHSFEFKVGTTRKRCPLVYPDTSFGQQPIFFVDVFAYDTTKVLAAPMRVCLGDTITFTGKVLPEKRYVNYVWNMGDTSLNEILPDTVRKKVYNKPGKYKVTFMGDLGTVPSTDKICPMKDSIEVEVALVKADFDIDSTRVPLFCFNNTSTNSVKNRWSFYNPVDLMQITPLSARIFLADGNSADYDLPQICEDYRDSLGSYWVCLEAENDIGCKDTICKKLTNNFKADILPPNVFSPNNNDFKGADVDGLTGNDVFNIHIDGEVKYELVIYDRWGVRMFESKDKNIDWNGKVNNTGAVCPDGTYFYILHYRYKGIDKDEPVLNGTVTIIR
jgi:gliding motility-associated-like protein